MNSYNPDYIRHELIEKKGAVCALQKCNFNRKDLIEIRDWINWILERRNNGKNSAMQQ